MSDKEPSQPTTDRIDWEYTCTNCRRGFNPEMAHQIVIVNETEAELMCSWCKHVDTYHQPSTDEVERPPAIVGQTLQKDAEERFTARIFFEGGAWLQYRETTEGRVCEEVFTADGDRTTSFNAEIEYDGCDIAQLYDSPKEYCRRAIKQYEKFTVRGLRIQKPHVGAVLVPLSKDDSPAPED